MTRGGVRVIRGQDITVPLTQDYISV
uniref:Uncharacterized protein n=1 Tax=Anguilla anguilla TaxID=7936 RepID=A0A0E9Q7X2_ANGAN